MSETISSDKSSKHIKFQSSNIYCDNKIEDVSNYPVVEHDPEAIPPSLLTFLKLEVTRDYALEHDEERYSAQREKVYSFMKIPKEVERFMRYGFLQCTDSFLFVYTFLPIRVVLAFGALLTRPFSKCFGVKRKSNNRILTPAEVCDLLKAAILFVSSTCLLSLDTNMLYHLIKSQSIIKLYIFYNMLEVGDRLFSAFGQDTIDALFWTATEPRNRKRQHLGVIPHLIVAVVYVIFHSILVLLQATTLNVAMNANNKALLTIMMSNNFVELKGSVFKKFDKNNLFQVSCSDVRERFHLCTLLFIVALQTMKEYSWKSDHLWILLPDCLLIVFAEIIVDWLKHAFITRFNELPLDVYRDYSISLAYDMAQTRQKHAFSDHSDLVARRMGFIPLPLGVVMIRLVISSVSSVHFNDVAAIILILLTYLCLVSAKILNSIVILGKACNLIAQHKLEKTTAVQSMSPETVRKPIIQTVAATMHNAATSPLKTTTATTPSRSDTSIESNPMASDLSSPAIFTNSTVDLQNATLNEELLTTTDEAQLTANNDSSAENVTRSFPDIQQSSGSSSANDEYATDHSIKRAESEPSMTS